MNNSNASNTSTVTIPLTTIRGYGCHQLILKSRDVKKLNPKKYVTGTINDLLLAAMPTGLGLGALGYNGSLVLAFRYANDLFDGAAAKDFGEQFLESLNWLS